jgi:hypothetical protein
MFEEMVDDFMSKNGFLPPYKRIWIDTPPEPGVGFQVIRDEWNKDFSVRTIHEFKLVSVSLDTIGAPHTSVRAVDE